VFSGPIAVQRAKMRASNAGQAVERDIGRVAQGNGVVAAVGGMPDEGDTGRTGSPRPELKRV
jgi:hypothetical protein